MSDKKNWITCGILLLVMFYGIRNFPPILYLFGAFIAFGIGSAQLKKNPTPGPSVPFVPVPNNPLTPTTTNVELPERKMPDNIPANLKCPSCGANIQPTDRKCAFCGSSLQPVLDLPQPAKLGALEVGGSVRVVHPVKGALDYKVRGRLLFTELWQASRGPQVPWTPTGNYFAGFALEPAAYLLNWQDRFYILDSHRGLTDMEINRDFAPYARKFAQSDQTGRVDFQYNGTDWQMVDIGRFAIEFEDGQGCHLHKGAIGRFIHSSKDNQALLVDDFQSGGSGGQDTLWKGFQIKETDITF
jgi:hypothetical protein